MKTNITFLAFCILLAGLWISTAIKESNKPESIKIIEYQKEQQQIELDKKNEAEQKRIKLKVKEKIDTIINRDGFSYFDLFNLPKQERALVLSRIMSKGFDYFLILAILVGIANFWFWFSRRY